MSAPTKSKHQSIAVRRGVMAALGAVAVGACLPMTAALAQQTTGQQGQQGKGGQGDWKRSSSPVHSSPHRDAFAGNHHDRRMDAGAGINTVSEAMQRLPANNAGTITNNWNVGFNFATGATAPALRGLTVQDTLSIVDGLRMAPYPLADDGQRNFVDLNTIPKRPSSALKCCVTARPRPMALTPLPAWST